MVLRLLLLFSITSSTLFAQTNFKTDIKEFRVEYLENFSKHDYSPFYEHPESLSELRFYKAKPNYRVVAKIELTEKMAPVQIKTYSGREKTFKQFAWAHFELKGKKHKLALYEMFGQGKIPQLNDDLFVPFKDFTNGDKTYGGGRYIDIKKSSITNGTIEIDFNKCYNPYCAFATGYNCPVPPIENHLQRKIVAGEKMYHGPKLKRPE